MGANAGARSAEIGRLRVQFEDAGWDGLAVGEGTD
jgi:hypothetical protein